MNLTPSIKRIVEMKFDSFVKKCCRNELRNIEKYYKRIRQREISIPDYSNIVVQTSMGGVESSDYSIRGHEIVISNPSLFRALEKLEPREREQILLIFFMGYKPVDVSKELNVVERTIYNRQKKILMKMRQLMEEDK